MSDNAFDAFTRSAAAAIDRRRSLVTLGGGALVAALAGPIGAQAADKNKKKLKKVKKRAQRRCRRQTDQCKDFLTQLCNDLTDNQEEFNECFNAFDQCCDILGGCDATGFLNCVRQVLEGPVMASILE